MKQLLIIMGMVLSLTTYAQTSYVPPAETDTPKKAQYKKVVTIDLAEVQVLLNALQRWKELDVYDPRKSDADKVITIKELDTFSKQLMEKIKIDSIMVVQPKNKP